MPSGLELVGLKEWPFDLVPPTRPSHLWYGRPEFRSDLERIVTGWTFRRSSSIYLLWADFGAGKTHALRYVQGLCESLPQPALSVYAELPSDISDFMGVYSRIARRVPEHALIDSIQKFRSAQGTAWLSAEGLNGDRDTPRALWQLADAPEDMQDVARRWLHGSKLSASELRLLNGVQPLKTSDDARRVLATICYLVVEFGGYSRFVLLLDEFQRVGQTTTKHRLDVNAGLHTFYNACPTDLTIVLSYSIGSAEVIKHLVSGELMSRVEEQLSLTMMSVDEACGFIGDVLRVSGVGGREVALTSRAVRALVERLDADSGHTLTPRRLMQVFGATYQSLLVQGEGVALPIDGEAALPYYRRPTADAIT